MSNDKDIIPTGKAITIIIAVVVGSILLIGGGLYFAVSSFNNKPASQAVAQETKEINTQSQTDESNNLESPITQNATHTDNEYINAVKNSRDSEDYTLEELLGIEYYSMEWWASTADNGDKYVVFSGISSNTGKTVIEFKFKGDTLDFELENTYIDDNKENTNNRIGTDEPSNDSFDEMESAKADSYYEEDTDSYNEDDLQYDYMAEGYGENAIRQYLEFEFGTSEGFNIDFSPEDSIRGDNPKYFFSIIDPSPRHMMDVYVNMNDSTIEDVDGNYIFTFMIDMNE